MFAITVDHNERNILRDISFGSFGSFIIITVVVLFIISEGEIIDSADCIDLTPTTKKKKAK